MTGGAGFSRQGAKALEENRKLRQIRPKSSSPDGISREKNMNKADLKSSDDSIKFRMSRYSSVSKSGYFFAIMVILTLAWIIWTAFF
ncbi:hypothetical protein LV84_04223 [Algoriphagus ratkowskyi]|uniref:Uncharacterized protein n=1 Tax=Algoriphagus ratkowskyi TaxID=57028 RepID=A0A2W7R0U3_9BACT|nr:hypothetical protein [Algoriphagus ratkowskyi]PZX49537.1 hypothetical protein LV84_04223 [Algoriphagus ratkowskyi]TXD75404.1 hypothetical protein ESW18_20535 [Algoriphagus ratkowskyi]